MNLKTDQKIQDGLLKKQNPQAIARKLLKQKTLVQNPENFLAICRFMYQAGLHTMLIQTAMEHLKTKRIVPWAFIINILDHCRIDLSKEMKIMFFNGIIEQDQVPYVLTCCSWDYDHPKWVNMKMDEINRINREKNSQFIQLMEDLEFIKSQGLLKKEEEIIKNLKKLAPDNPNVHEKWIQFKERWGRDVLQGKKRSSLKNNHVYMNRDPVDPKEFKQVKSIMKSVQELILKHPKSGYNMALIFFFMDYPKFAVQILKDHLNSNSAKWLYADLLLQSRLYLNCLSFLDMIEKEDSAQPETVFALTYMRAKAYHGLGKKKKAKSILTELLKVRPNYRLAHYLLEQWRKGDDVQ